MIGALGEEEVQQLSLKKVLKIRHVAAIALGFTVADGILLVLSQLLPMLGPSVIIVTIIAGLAYSLILFTGAELAGAMPAADFAGEWGKRTIGGFFGFITDPKGWEDIEPNVPELLFERGCTSELQGDLEGALVDFDLAHCARPDAAS